MRPNPSARPDPQLQYGFQLLLVESGDPRTAQAVRIDGTDRQVVSTGVIGLEGAEPRVIGKKGRVRL